MASNTWIGSLTGRVASARKIAAEKIGQAAKNLDEKLKKVEDEVAKYRSFVFLRMVPSPRPVLL